MGRNTCDGDIYIHNLSSFIKAHEPQLANALVAYKKLNSSSNKKVATDDAHNNDSLGSATTKEQKVAFKENINTSIDEEEKLAKEISKPVRLSLSLHHLYFILGKLKDLGITVGPMNLRLENIDSNSNSNYVSFLSEFQRNKKIDSDSQSIHSISSVKSVMSSVSALWNNFGSTSKVDSTVADLKYLYSAFSKLPCLRLANEPNSKLIEGHQEYPFETATPLIIFQNLLVLEVCDLEPKEIYGWHVLSKKLRYLVVKKANISDPIEIIVNLVEADALVKGDEDSISLDNSNNNNINFDNTDNINHQQIVSDDEYCDYDNRLRKSKSNSSDSNDHRMPSFPSSHSTINLASHVMGNKSHTSPKVLQSQSFTPLIHSHYNLNQHQKLSQNAHNLYYPSSYHSPYHQHANDSFQNFSTSPTSSPINHYPTRLYAEDVVNSQQTVLSSSVNSTRRSYYYKPHTKSRRSRGSSSMSITTAPSYGAVTLSENQLKSCSQKREDAENAKEHIGFPSNIQSSKHIVNHTKLSENDAGGQEKDKISDVSSTNTMNLSSWQLLKHLSLTENKIERLSLGSFVYLTNLTLLDLSYNRLTQIPEAPLSQLVNLKTLNLSFNKLLNTFKFPKNLKKLTFLNLRGNKITHLESIENLSSLSKIDLRQNNLYKVTDLKPLLLINQEKVQLTSIYLTGNPVAKSRGYRVELFNLFNGIDYENFLKIDGSRPGIFESRMLLDEKTARMRFKNYLDESIISKMTASVSNMNLANLLNKNSNAKSTTNKDINLHQTDSQAAFIKIDNINASHSSNPLIEENKTSYAVSYVHPILDQMSTSINVSKDVTKAPPSPLARNFNDGMKQGANMKMNNTDYDEDFVFSSSPSITSARNSVLANLRNNVNSTSESNMITNLNPSISNRNGSLTNLNDVVIKSDFIAPVNRSLPHSQRTSNDFSTASSIITSNGTTIGADTNPVTRLTLASPALPVITQATTTTTSVTNKLAPSDTNSIHTNKDLLIENSLENKENIPKKILKNDVTASNDEYSTGLKISVS